MFRAPAAELGVPGWLLLALLWGGVVLVVWELSRPLRRRLFPPRRGDYVVLSEHVRLVERVDAPRPRPVTQAELDEWRDRWDAAHGDPSPVPRRARRG